MDANLRRVPNNKTFKTSVAKFDRPNVQDTALSDHAETLLRDAVENVQITYKTNTAKIPAPVPVHSSPLRPPASKSSESAAQTRQNVLPGGGAKVEKVDLVSFVWQRFIIGLFFQSILQFDGTPTCEQALLHRVRLSYAPF